MGSRRRGRGRLPPPRVRRRCRGRLRAARPERGGGAVISFTSVAVVAAVALVAPLATGLGIILPILKDAGETSTPFGQVIVAGASIAEVGPIVLLSLFFSGHSGGLGGKLVLLIGFVVFVVAVGLAILGLERSMRVSA